MGVFQKAITLDLLELDYIVSSNFSYNVMFDTEDVWMTLWFNELMRKEIRDGYIANLEKNKRLNHSPRLSE